MLPRYEPRHNSPFHEYVGLLDQITATPVSKVKLEERFSNDKTSSKIDLSPVTGKDNQSQDFKILDPTADLQGRTLPLMPIQSLSFTAAP